MILNVFIDDQTHAIEVPQYVVEDGGEFFEKMDRDMDRGWQMGREWMDHPDTLQRCQIAADKLLTAMVNQNEALSMMMAAYILTRVPGVTGVNIDTHGDLLATEFVVG